MLSRLFLFATLLASSCLAYVRLGFTDSGGAFVPLSRPDAAGIQFSANDQIKAGQVSTASGAPVNVVGSGSNPTAAIRAALSTWNAVPGTKLKLLPLISTARTHDSTDYRMTVTFASADDLSLMGYVPGKSTGAIGLTVNSWAVEKGQLSNGTQVEKGSIIDSDILLNSALTYSTDGSTPYDIQAVITHEIGHALGANHTVLLGATMFPFGIVGTQALLGQRLLSSDDAAFAAAAYSADSASLGNIGGKIAAPDGSAVKAAIVTMIDTAGANTLSTLSGTDGTWSLTGPPGDYIVYAEPFNNVVGPANIISLDPSQVTSGFQTSILGGALSPTIMSLAAGSRVGGADITVQPSAQAISLPLQNIGAAGGSGDIRSVRGASGPMIVPSGTSFDIGLVGGGVDALTTVRVLGQGISVRSGSIRVDTGVNYSLGPMLRATIDVAPRQSPTLATMLILKGTSAAAVTGLFVVVPPKPAFIAKGVVNAASFKGGEDGEGVVSPGGLYSVYDIPGSPNLGPATFAQPKGYDPYGEVPANLSGVSVTFDGISAPIFLAYGAQLNVQVPFEVAGKKTTSVQVTYYGSASDPVQVSVVPSQPAFFTYTPGGKDSIVGNQDYSFNTEKNPEARGRVVTIYGTGIGKPTYPVATGQGAPAPPAGVGGGGTCTLGGARVVGVAFTGWTPTSVGLAQWSMVLPPDSPTGAVSVACTDAYGGTTPTGTLYIK